MDYYSQRLSEKKQDKEVRLSKTLPTGRPNPLNPKDMNNSLRTMAGNPVEPQDPQDPHSSVEDSDFKSVFDNLSKDDGFKNGMAEFATIMKTMKKDMEGLNLPVDVMKRRVEQVINQYSRGSQQVDADKAAMGDTGFRAGKMGGGYNGY